MYVELCLPFQCGKRNDMFEQELSLPYQLKCMNTFSCSIFNLYFILNFEIYIKFDLYSVLCCWGKFSPNFQCPS